MRWLIFFVLFGSVLAYSTPAFNNSEWNLSDWTNWNWTTNRYNGQNAWGERCGGAITAYWDPDGELIPADDPNGFLQGDWRAGPSGPPVGGGGQHQAVLSTAGPDQYNGMLVSRPFTVPSDAVNLTMFVRAKYVSADMGNCRYNQRWYGTQNATLNSDWGESIAFELWVDENNDTFFNQNISDDWVFWEVHQGRRAGDGANFERTENVSVDVRAVRGKRIYVGCEIIGQGGADAALCQIDDVMFEFADIPTNLSIGNDGPKYVDELMTFWANYSDANGTILNATCQITFDNTTWYRMDFNGSLYVYNTSFSQNGTFGYNVSCSKYMYESRMANDTYTVLYRPPAILRVEPATYHNCPSIVYFKVVMDGSSNYRVDINDVDGDTVYSENSSNTTYYGAYELGPYAELGNWTVSVNDLIWLLTQNKSFEVRAAPSYQTIVQLADEYWGIADNGNTRLNVYAINGTTYCNLTVWRADGTQVYYGEANISGTFSITMSSIVGWSGYPMLLHVMCDRKAVVTRGPNYQGIVALQNPAQLSDRYYGVIEQSGDVRLSAFNGPINWTIVTHNADGSISNTYAGVLGANASVVVTISAGTYPAGVEVWANNSFVVYFEPEGRAALMYSQMAISPEGFALLYDKWGSYVHIYAPSGPTNVTLSLYAANYNSCENVSPDYEVCTSTICRHRFQIPSNGSVTKSYLNILLGCGLLNVFPDNPLGTFYIDADNPVIVTVKSWNDAAATSPIYRSGSYFQRNYFVLSTSPIDYMVYSPYENTQVWANGVNVVNLSAYQAYAGSVSANYINVTASKPVAVSVKQGVGQSVVVAGD